MTAQLDAEAQARADFRSDDAQYIAGLARRNVARLEYLASLQNEVDWINRQREASTQQRQALALVADAEAQDSRASRELAVNLEAEAEARKRGIAQGTIWYQLLLAMIAVRERDADAAKGQTAAQESLNKALADQRQTQAEFTDWQTQGAAAKAYGSDLAGILQQYGLLSRATEELRIQEEIRQAVVAAGLIWYFFYLPR